MMKKLIITGIVATMVMGFAGMASAAFDANWAINIATSTSLTTLSNSMTGTFKTKAGFSDVKAGEDTVLPAYGTQTAYIKSVNGGGDLYIDGRNSFTGNTITWQLELGAANFSPAGIYLIGWNPANAGVAVYNDWAPTTESIKLYKVAEFGGARELLWAVDGTKNGAGTLADANTWKSDRAFQAGDKFELEVAAVPEPGSMLALFSGLAGMVGYGIRRRK